jgi:hypothetical protein
MSENLIFGLNVFSMVMSFISLYLAVNNLRRLRKERKDK